MDAFGVGYQDVNEQRTDVGLVFQMTANLAQVYARLGLDIYGPDPFCCFGIYLWMPKSPTKACLRGRQSVAPGP